MVNSYFQKGKSCPDAVSKKLFEAQGKGLDEGLSYRKQEFDALHTKFVIIEKDIKKLKKELRDYGKLLMGTLLEE